MRLLGFQQRFWDAAFDPYLDTVCASWPRGQGKTTLMGELITEIMKPESPHFAKGLEPVLVSSSIGQARQAFRMARANLEPLDVGHTFVDSGQRIGINHKKSHTELRILGSGGKTAFGLVNAGWCFVDEPGAMELAAGEMLWDAITTGQGKEGSPLRVVAVGTLGPMATGPGHWWYDLIHTGSTGSTHIEFLQGDTEKWSDLRAVYRANPLARISKDMRAKLRTERDEAYSDSRLRARFFTFRLNVPSEDTARVLLAVTDWQKLLQREPGKRDGSPIVALDVGSGRAWSAAVAMYPSGFTDCFALAPGLPDLREQEKRDRVPGGTYQRLYDKGLLEVDTGRNVQRVEPLIDGAVARWGRPSMVIADRFKVKEVADHLPGNIRLEPRVTQWSEATYDVRSLRAGVADGPYTFDANSRDLMAASLAVSIVENDKAGNTRLVKRGVNNQSRDDIAAAWLLASGEWKRRQGQPARTWRSRGTT